MSLQQQSELLSKLSELGLKMPGLNSDAIITKLSGLSEELKEYNSVVDAEVAENIERGMAKTEADKLAKDQKAEMLVNYKKNIKPSVDEKITVIRQQYKIFTEAVNSIPEDIQSTVTNIALPPAIAAPAATPNPVYALNLAKQTKNSLTRTLGIAIAAFTEIIKAATAIKYEIPDGILSLFNKIQTISKALSTIPV